MQAFALLLLALPAALTAPAPAPVDAAAAKAVLACACSNAAGETRASGYCQYQIGRLVQLDGQEYCFPAATYARNMDAVFTSSYCGDYVPGFPTPACKTVNVCPVTEQTQTIC